MEKVKDVLRIKNSYDNLNERISFDIRIRKCDSLIDGIECKSDEVIERLLKMIRFDILYLKDFVNHNVKGKSQLVTTETFHS